MGSDRFHGRREESRGKDLPVPARGVRLLRQRPDRPDMVAATAHRPWEVTLATALTALLLVLDVVFIAADPTRSRLANSTHSTWAILKNDATDARQVASSGTAPLHSLAPALLIAVLLAVSAVLIWRGRGGGQVLLTILGGLGVVACIGMLVSGTLSPTGYVYVAVVLASCAALLRSLWAYDARQWFSVRDGWQRVR